VHYPGSVIERASQFLESDGGYKRTLFRALFVREFLERNSLAVKLASSNISLFHSQISDNSSSTGHTFRGGRVEEHPCEHLGPVTQAMAAEFIPGGAKLRKIVRWSHELNWGSRRIAGRGSS